MRTSFRPIVMGAWLVASAVSAFAQAPAKPAAPSTPAPGAAAPTTAGAAATPPAIALPVPPPNYVYSPDGRRDPFTSLINRGVDARAAAAGKTVKKVEGVAGLQTADLVVKGIVQSRGAWAAMVSGPDGKTYTVRAGDRLLDGVVRSVTGQAVVILQEVNDPLSLEKQREVRKFLRGGEEVK